MNIASISSSVAQQSLAASSAEEATETLQQTKLEAAQGDRQAIQKLARINAQAQQAAPATGSGADSAPMDPTSVVFTAKV